MRPNASGDRDTNPSPLAVGPQRPRESDDSPDTSPTVAELRLPAADLALSTAFARRPDLSVRAELVATSRPDRPFSFAWVDAGDGLAAENARSDPERSSPDDTVDALLDALAVDPTVGVRSVVVRRGDAALCDLAFCDDVALVADVVTGNDGTILTADATGGEWSLRVRYPSRASLAETVSTLERFGVATRLSQIGCQSVSTAADLTEKQRETVAIAFERGYFEIPRQVSLEDLAEELDVTHQALSERLRRAEQTLLGSEFGD